MGDTKSEATIVAVQVVTTRLDILAIWGKQQKAKDVAFHKPQYCVSEAQCMLFHHQILDHGGSCCWMLALAMDTCLGHGEHAPTLGCGFKLGFGLSHCMRNVRILFVVILNSHM